VKNFNTLTYLYFAKILLVEHKAKSICKAVISSKELNLIKKIAEFAISKCLKYFIYMLAKFNNFFKVLKTDFTMQYFQYFVGTLMYLVVIRMSKHPNLLIFQQLCT